eukprot:3520167-Rhodomonas_salina.4
MPTPGNAFSQMSHPSISAPPFPKRKNPFCPHRFTRHWCADSRAPSRITIPTPHTLVTSHSSRISAPLATSKQRVHSRPSFDTCARCRSESPRIKAFRA